MTLTTLLSRLRVCTALTHPLKSARLTAHRHGEGAGLRGGGRVDMSSLALLAAAGGPGRAWSGLVVPPTRQAFAYQGPGARCRARPLRTGLQNTQE